MMAIKLPRIMRVFFQIMRNSFSNYADYFGILCANYAQTAIQIV